MVQKMRAFWARSGFYVSLAALILMLGGAGMWYRSRQPAAVHAVSAAESLPKETEFGQSPEISFQWPLEGEVISHHAPNAAVYRRELGIFSGHTGIDLSAPEGTDVCAAESGTVTSVYRSPEYGCTVEIKTRDGVLLRYGCLSEQSEVEPSDCVLRGQRIGKVGDYPCAERAYGAHLHFEVIENGISQNPEDFLAK
ncbi:MAG: M23 family metallopeptidase [Clostridiales bacterium]|nr:M23 family metallopeptidase [Clostridiales bacterium]